VTLAKFFPGLDWMHQADSVAALAVALIVIYVSAQLGWRTIAALVDSAPEGMTEKVEQAARSISDVVDAHAVRIRPSGPIWFIDLHVTMNGSIHLSRAHANAELIEKAVQAIVPGADVTVHMEPAEERPER
jgi:divalent metal cation (Fe/Co/Zn/Cd) transporter